ncbi:uncharacterized protein LOC141850465 isoform X2 [Brevipalpus obovatus]|uniref:uncharacterized protein LOC141850465 isoform X2 n=1 Tax=Brevipalpus obovatus TaxID=246614 RepID=UPI003D9E15FB
MLGSVDSPPPVVGREGQYRKCITEKRRREQENNYIQELAELLYDEQCDDNSLINKIDKSAILQKTVEAISSISKHSDTDSGSERCPISLPSTSCNLLAPRSSPPKPLIERDILGSILLDAVDGFVLMINSNAQIEFVSKNVQNFLGYNQDEMIGESIYKFIHNGDRFKIYSNLLPKTQKSADGTVCTTDRVSFSSLVASNIDFSCFPANNSSSFLREDMSSSSNDCMITSSGFQSTSKPHLSKQPNQFYVRFALNHSDLSNETWNYPRCDSVDLGSTVTSSNDDCEIISTPPTPDPVPKSPTLPCLVTDDIPMETDHNSIASLDQANTATLSINSPISSESSSTVPPLMKRPAFVNMQLYTRHQPVTLLRSKLDQQSKIDDSLLDDGSESEESLLVCIARRRPTSDYNPSMINVEQFSTKLDHKGKILAVDNTGLSSKYSQYLNKGLIGKNIFHLCHPNDVSMMEEHLKEAIIKQNVSIVSPIYRFCLTAERYISIQTKSKLFDWGSKGSFIASQNSIAQNLPDKGEQEAKKQTFEVSP